MADDPNSTSSDKLATQFFVGTMIFFVAFVGSVLAFVL